MTLQKFKRKVVFIMRQFAIGGLERVVMMQARICVEEGYDVAILILDGGPGNSLVVECDPRVSVRVLPAGLLARRSVLSEVCDSAVILLHFGYGKLYPKLRMALLGAGALRVIRFCHSDYSRLRNPVTNALDRILGHKDEMIAVGGGAKSFLVDVVGLPSERIRTLANVAPPTPHSVALPPGGVTLLTVSDVEPHKGIDDVVAALAMTLSPREPKLSVVGDGSDLIRVWRLAQELGVLHRIDWMGAIWHQPTVQSVLGATDVFISMSKAEGIPLSVLEAVRHNVPHLVLSDIPGHRSAAGDNAIYVNCHDPAALAQVLDGISADRADNDRTGPRQLPASGPSYHNDYKVALQNYGTALAGLLSAPRTRVRGTDVG
ncbi:glycosyltransferase family 4 protein [Streptomyces sp. WAC05858]|uniref:glycosyltransferase family 4 protein n=1 Tax=Streptomyces TaxID=1883 RepID=UPI000F776CC1|nr:glycosyltransferase family 4 protein [Streptomyces sp. WAC05858]RSS35051.1 glycosyltransferase [Streptomyces sp. WAC05858]WTB04026.1 glycosyltransferase family 4 protein [Streptomyces antimycoticus]